MTEHDETEEIRQIIEEAIRSRNLPQRWLTPEQLRRAAEVWVDGRNSVTATREALRGAGILASMKTEYLVPDSLKEPLYSAVLDLMVERGEWNTEPGTTIPMYKRTPTIKYRFKV